jgi:hypothetical protein
MCAVWSLRALIWLQSCIMTKVLKTIVQCTEIPASWSFESKKGYF